MQTITFNFHTFCRRESVSKKYEHLRRKCHIPFSNKTNFSFYTFIMNAALCGQHVLPMSVWVFPQYDDEDIGLIGETGSPPGVSGSTKRSVISIRLMK